MTRLDEAARAFVALFEQLGVPYAIMGGFAVRVYGLPRPTFDIDFTVAIARTSLPELCRAARELGFSIPVAQESGWVDEVQGLPVVKFQWFLGDRAIDIDVFIAETAFQREVLARRKEYRADDWQSWFVTPEDLVLLKLIADRPKDRADIADVLFIQGDLDKEYMQRWAKSLGLAEALEEALRQAES